LFRGLSAPARICCVEKGRNRIGCDLESAAGGGAVFGAAYGAFLSLTWGLGIELVGLDLELAMWVSCSLACEEFEEDERDIFEPEDFWMREGPTGGASSPSMGSDCEDETRLEDEECWEDSDGNTICVQSYVVVDCDEEEE